MNKIMRQCFSTNNLQVSFGYSWSSADQCPVIVHFAIWHCGLDVTKKISSKRADKILQQVKAALESNHRLIRLQCEVTVAA